MLRSLGALSNLVALNSNSEVSNLSRPEWVSGDSCLIGPKLDPRELPSMPPMLPL